MKVMICIPCLLVGGTEIQTLNLVEALVTAGHDVVTVCYFEFSRDMVERYRQAGSKVELLDREGRRPDGVRNTLRHLYGGLRRMVGIYKPDVAHVQYMAPGLIPILLLWLLGVRRIVATAHTSADIYPSLKLLHFVSRHILTAFLCITECAEKTFFGCSQMYGPELRLNRHNNHFTIYNNLPPYIAVADKEKLCKESIMVGVVSRLEPIKGMDLVVPAFSAIHAANPSIRLLVVGDGSLRKLMELQAKESGLEQVIEFVGRQSQQALQGYYDRIDILLMPSRSEGFGLTAIEGMARGCVVVAADTGGLPEVVKDGETGLLHRCGQVRDIADKVNGLLSEPERLRRMSRKAVERVALFSTEEYHALIKDLYNKLL